jgi:HK97 family phage portal protein
MPVVFDPTDRPVTIRASHTHLDQQGNPVEIAPGRGDLRTSSVPFEFSGPFWNGRPVSYAKIYETQPWVAIAVMRLLTWSVRVPLKVYRRVADDEVARLRPGDHPLAAAVIDPWDRGTMAALVTGMLGPLLVHGNGLTDVHQGARGQLRFEPLDWRAVMPLRFDDADPNSEIVGWKIGLAGDERSADSVMHLRWWSPLGQLGISPLEQIRRTVLSEDAATQWALSNLNNGARPSGLVELDERFLGLHETERQALLDQARADLRAAYSGPENAGKLPVLPPGMKWASTPQTTAVEAELINQRLVYRNEVAAIYMIPPPMIGQLDRATFSNIQTQREMAYTDALAPPLVLIEQMINAHIVHGLLREVDVFVEFDFGPILRGDRLKEIQALREAIGSGLLAPNEGRAVLNQTRYQHENADKLWMPTNNLKPIDAEIPAARGAR